MRRAGRVVGHAGDGNLHPVIVVDLADPSHVDRGRLVFDERPQVKAACDVPVVDVGARLVELTARTARWERHG